MAWRFESTKETPFFSRDCGHAQRLPKGNTLANESLPGRAIEITKDGEIVWEYRDPFRTPNGKVARFYEFRRLPADYDVSWTK